MLQLRDWAPALTGMACLGLGAGLIGIYGFFVEHLSREFDVGVATINIGPVALLLIPGLLGPLVGKLVDRVPIRYIMLAGATIAMSGLYLSSTADSLLVAALGFMGFALGLSMYGPVVVNGLLVKLYPGREARALALAAIGISIATMFLPPVVGWLLIEFDWRIALATVSAAILVVLWFVILAGVPLDTGRNDTSSAVIAEEPTFYRSPNFWLVGFTVALALNASIILAICYPPHFVNRGFTVTQAGYFVAMAGLAGLCGKSLIAVFSHFVTDNTRAVAIFLLLGQALGLLLLLVSENTTEVIAAIMLTGACSGGFIPMHPYLNSCYFDARVIGQVNGAQMPLFLPFGLVGAPLAGYLFDRQGHYSTVLVGLAVVLLVAAVLVVLLPKINPSARPGG